MLAAIAQLLLVLALAADEAFVAPAGAGDTGWLRYLPLVGAASGIALRGYLLHRRSGTRNGLLWALAQGGSMALLLLGMVVVATAIGPAVRGNPTLDGDSWMAIMAVAVVLGLTSTLLWERDAQRRRTAAILLLATSLIIGGLVGIRGGGWWTLIGAPSLFVGMLAIGLAALRGLSDLMGMAESSA